MQLWAVARYDLGLSWPEFEDLTPGMFWELCKRRDMARKHERFANALTASAVYNSRRTSEEQPIITAYDFIRDPESSRKREEIETLKRQIREQVTMLPVSTPRAHFMAMRERIIATLEAQGRTDAKELWAECWPSLVPTEGE